MHTRRAGARTALIIGLQVLLIAALGVGLGLRDLGARGGRVRLSVNSNATTGNNGTPAGTTPAGVPVPAPGTSGTDPNPGPDDPPPPEAPKPEESTPPSSQPFEPSSQEALAGKAGHITIARAQELQAQGAIFLDARPTEEYTAGHIAGAHFAPLSVFREGTPPAILTDIPKELATIVVYCGGGDDCSASEDVMILLLNEGFTSVHVLHDGYKGWSAMGLPTSTGEAP
jgi:rhodanese-related sulfurtransferase